MSDELYIDLLAFDAKQKPGEPLEQRLKRFIEADRGTESLDDKAFDSVNGSGTKADYLLGGRRMIAELKTLNGSPHERLQNRLRERFKKPDAPVVFGTLGISQVIASLSDREEVNKMMVDVASRAVRRHLHKADEQIGAIKERLGLPEAGGLLVLINDGEEMIDLAAIGYALKNAFETVKGGFPNITNVWATVESHRIPMPNNREGYGQLHVFKSLERRAELDFMGRMLGAWGAMHNSRMERLIHRGDWDVMRPIYDGPPPVFEPYD